MSDYIFTHRASRREKMLYGVIVILAWPVFASWAAVIAVKGEGE